VKQSSVKVCELFEALLVYGLPVQLKAVMPLLPDVATAEVALEVALELLVPFTDMVRVTVCVGAQL